MSDLMERKPFKVIATVYFVVLIGVIGMAHAFSRWSDIFFAVFIGLVIVGFLSAILLAIWNC